jgi:hypothetical protein
LKDCPCVLNVTSWVGACLIRVCDRDLCRLLGGRISSSDDLDSCRFLDELLPLELLFSVLLESGKLNYRLIIVRRI